MVADPIVNTFFLAKVKEAGGYRSSTDGDGVLHLYHLSGISQVGVNYFPHQKLPVEFDATGPPLWSSYNFHAPSTLNDIRGKDIYCLSCMQIYVPFFLLWPRIKLSFSGDGIYSFYFFLLDAVVKYNDFVRLEASLYGCTAERKSLIQVDS